MLLELVTNDIVNFKVLKETVKSCNQDIELIKNKLRWLIQIEGLSLINKTLVASILSPRQ